LRSEYQRKRSKFEVSIILRRAKKSYLPASAGRHITTMRASMRRTEKYEMTQETWCWLWDDNADVLNLVRAILYTMAFEFWWPVTARGAGALPHRVN